MGWNRWETSKIFFRPVPQRVNLVLHVYWRWIWKGSGTIDSRRKRHPYVAGILTPSGLVVRRDVVQTHVAVKKKATQSPVQKTDCTVNLTEILFYVGLFPLAKYVLPSP